jgi:hypothetical protein
MGFFSRLFGRATDDTWQVATGEDDGKPRIFRIRNRPPSFASEKDYHQLVAVCWRYQSPNDRGLPSPAHLPRMDEFEDLLEEVLERVELAFLTAVITNDGMREWHWYARDHEAVRTAVNRALGDYDLPVQVVWKDDPDWSFRHMLLDLLS